MPGGVRGGNREELPYSIVENWYRFITIHPSFSFLLPLVKGEGREGVSILFREGLGEVERRQYKFKIKNNRR